MRNFLQLSVPKKKERKLKVYFIFTMESFIFISCTSLAITFSKQARRRCYERIQNVVLCWHLLKQFVDNLQHIFLDTSFKSFKFNILWAASYLFPFRFTLLRLMEVKVCDFIALRIGCVMVIVFHSSTKCGTASHIKIFYLQI